MEAWKDELYHYGVRGMKWKKKKRALTNEELAAKKKQDRMNASVTDIEKKARQLERATRARDEARYEAEHGAPKNKHDQRIADSNAKYAAKNLQKVKNANGKAIKEHHDEYMRVIKNRNVIRALGRPFTVRKKRNWKTGEVTTTRKVKGGKTVTVDNGRYRSTKYVPKPKKEKGKGK